jgi:hypothetical protein
MIISEQNTQQTELAVDVSNIGGVDTASVEFSSGVTVLSGRNATNRTLSLRAIMAVLGSDRPAMKTDAEEGSVELSISDDTYTRKFERGANGVVTAGTPYLDDPTVADPFAFHFGDNDARHAIERNEKLRDIII